MYFRHSGLNGFVSIRKEIKKGKETAATQTIQYLVNVREGPVVSMHTLVERTIVDSEPFGCVTFVNKRNGGSPLRGSRLDYAGFQKLVHLFPYNLLVVGV